MNGVDEGATLDGKAQEDYDTTALEINRLDGHSPASRSAIPQHCSAAPVITDGTRTMPSCRCGLARCAGAAFVRAMMAILRSKGDTMRALDYAKAWKDSTPEVELMVKAAVAPGDTVNPAWAGALVQIRQAENEFLELLRPATIIGKITNLRQVPFNTQVPLQTGGGTYGWVGQGAAKPVTKLALTTTAIQFSKAAGIIVITEELAKLSSPSAEAIVRADMIAGIAQFLDAQFIDLAVVAVRNVSPGRHQRRQDAVSADRAATDLGTILPQLF